ncbi:MAG: hypothetical protein M3198_11695 [Actinomycetota bacterium]|nr:hypothetical protein [Actinomycetota bacterium]
MPGKRLEAFVAAALALAVVAGGCGTSSTSPSAELAASPTTRDLERFLIRANEAPGFSPSGKPETISGVRAFVADLQGTKADEQRLRDHGFQVFVVQPLEGPSDAAGVTNVSLFSTEEGAARELQYLLGNIDNEFPGAKIERFDVPGLSTATGYTAELPDGVKVANVNWSQGRCVMTLGSQPPFVDELRAGVRALYERTEGTCP